MTVGYRLFFNFFCFSRHFPRYSLWPRDISIVSFNKAMKQQIHVRSKCSDSSGKRGRTVQVFSSCHGSLRYITCARTGMPLRSHPTWKSSPRISDFRTRSVGLKKASQTACRAAVDFQKQLATDLMSGSAPVIWLSYSSSIFNNVAWNSSHAFSIWPILRF